MLRRAADVLTATRRRDVLEEATRLKVRRCIHLRCFRAQVEGVHRATAHARFHRCISNPWEW